MKFLAAKLGVLLIVILGIGPGCGRHVPSKDPVRSAPSAPPVPFNLSVQINDRSLDLSWEIADSSALASYRVYRSDSDEADFYLFDSSSTLSITVTGLPFDRPIRFRVTAVSTLNIEGRPSEEITAVAGLLSVVLEDGNPYTNDRNVQVRLSAPGDAVYVELSEDPLLVGALMQPFGTALSFELSGGDGTKTVFARVTFADGTVAGEVISDDIVLDTRARIDSVYFAPIGQVFAAGDTISFFLAADGEAGGSASISFPGVASVRLEDDGALADLTADDGIYAAEYIVPVALTVADGEVTGSFRDAAGNAAAGTRAVELLNIATTDPPEAVTLAVGLVDTATAHLTWTASEADDFDSYRVYRSDSPGIDVADDSLTIVIITHRTTLSHDDYLAAAGTYYYRIFVFDTQGLTAASNEVVLTR